MFAVQRGFPAPEPASARTRAGGFRAARPRAVRAVRAAQLPYLEAFRAGRAGRVGAETTADARPAWRELGPRLIPQGQTYGSGGDDRPPVSGRISSVAVDPSHPGRILIASAGGGLWHSLDSGARWEPLTDDLPVLAMGALAFAPSDPRIVYAGSGEGDALALLGVGLFRSSDGGATWSVCSDPSFVGQGFYDLVLDPSDAQHLWAATTAGLFESCDGGGSWRTARAGPTWDLSWSRDGEEMLAACRDGLFGSSDGGSTWQRVALPEIPSGSIDRIEVCHAPSNGGIVYVFASIGGRARFWRRASPGGGFVRQPLPRGLETGQAWYDWCAAVVPDDPDTVFLGAVELYRGHRRADGRWSWDNVSSRRSGDSIHPDQHHLAFAPSDARTLLVANDGGLFRSPDLGRTWQSLNPGLGITEFEFLAQHPSNLTWIIGGTQDNGTLRREHDTTWNQIAFGDGGDCGVNATSPEVCVHSYYDMGMELSTDGGNHWKDIGPRVSPKYQSLFYPPLEVLGETLAQAGESVFITENRGRVWAEVALPRPGGAAPLATALAFASPQEILVGTDRGRLYRIVRGPRGWDGSACVALATPRARAYVSDIHPGARGRIWVTYSTIGGGHLFVSGDAGVTWEDPSGNLPALPANAVLVDPATTQTVYVGTDRGVYRSLDGGGTWAEYGSGLPNAIVGDLILHARGRWMRAGTRNRGVWEIRV